MSGVWHRRMRHARRWLIYSGVVLLVLVATLMATASQLLPWVARHPDQIAEWLGQQLGQPVSVVKADAVWTRRGPLFTLSRSEEHTSELQSLMRISYDVFCLKKKKKQRKKEYYVKIWRQLNHIVARV